MDSFLLSHVLDHVIYNIKAVFLPPFLYFCISSLFLALLCWLGALGPGGVAVGGVHGSREGRACPALPIPAVGRFVRALCLGRTLAFLLTEAYFFWGGVVVNGYWILSSAFPAFTEKIIWFFSFILLIR